MFRGVKTLPHCDPTLNLAMGWRPLKALGWRPWRQKRIGWLVGRLQSPVLLVQTEAANFLLTVERVQRKPPWTVLRCCMKFAKQTCKGKSVQYFFVWNHSIDSSIRAATRQKIRTVSNLQACFQCLTNWFCIYTEKMNDSVPGPCQSQQYRYWIFRVNIPTKLRRCESWVRLIWKSLGRERR